jgi:hypothetical protein
VRKDYTRVLDVVFSYGDQGLRLLFKLADNGQLDMGEVSTAIGPASASLFASTLSIEGFAYIEGEAIVAMDTVIALARKIRETSNG